MYNLLIVDDEHFVTDGLSTLFKEEMHDKLDVYTAYSGIQAIEWLVKIRFDIVLSDVNMPYMNGITLHERILSKWPMCKVIFLSAYDDFNYIKAAIRNNAIDYILKSEGDEAILDAVKRTIEKIENEEKNRQLILKASMQLKKSFPQHQKDFLINLICDRQFTQAELKEKFDIQNLGLTLKKPALLMIARKDSGNIRDKYNESTDKIYDVCTIIEKYFSDYIRIATVVNEHREIFCFIQPMDDSVSEQYDKTNTDTWENLYVFITGTLEKVQSTCREVCDLTVSFALTRKPCDWLNINQSYDKLVNVFNYVFGFEKEIIIDENYIVTTGKLANGLNQTKFKSEGRMKSIESLALYLENNQLSNYIDELKDIFIESADVSEVRSDMEQEVFFCISHIISTYINKLVIKEQVANYIDVEKLTNIKSFGNCDDIRQYFSKIGELIIASKLKTMYSNNKNIVQKVNQYINDNLSGDISLATIASYVHFNPFYLSRLYKQLTGKSMSDYVLELRIETSKKLLKQEEIKISEIANAIGFSEHAYFTRFFKKYTNMTPSEYKDKQL